MATNSKTFMMITSDSESLSGRPAYAYDLIRKRLLKNLWPLYPKTPLKNKIAVGDRLYFYAGGRGKERMSIIGSATVSSISSNNHESFWEQVDEALTPEPTQLILLTSTQVLAYPKPIQPFRTDLSFMGTYPKWGMYMQGGVKALTAGDAALIEAN